MVASKAKSSVEILEANTLLEISFSEYSFGISVEENEVLISAESLFEVFKIERIANKAVISLAIVKKESTPDLNILMPNRVGSEIMHMNLFLKEPLNSEGSHFKVVLHGSGLYENGIFQLDVKYAKDHPFKPIALLFDTKICHPNIDKENGLVHADILKHNWSPALTLEKTILSVQAL